MLVSDALPFGSLWYAEPNTVHNAIKYAKFYRRPHDAVIRVYDAAGNVIESHEQPGHFMECKLLPVSRHTARQKDFDMQQGRAFQPTKPFAKR